MKNNGCRFVFALIGMIFCVCGSVAGAPNAQDILKSADRNDGLCVLLNVSDPELVIAIAQKSEFVVHAIHENADAVTAMRKAIDARGLYGRVSVNHASFDGGRLPYAENLVSSEFRVQGSEIERVLAPRGAALIQKSSLNTEHRTLNTQSPSGIKGWTKLTKPWPKEIDEWSHFRHNAEENMVADDTVVGPPRHVQWVKGPMFQRSHALAPGTTTMVTAGGRIFYIQDESPISFGGLPGQWRLIARDAFNVRGLRSVATKPPTRLKAAHTPSPQPRPISR